MVMPYFVSINNKDDILKSIKTFIANADVGTENYIRTDTSGFKIKIVCANNVNSAMSPPPHICSDPLNAPVELYEKWHEMWSYVQTNGLNQSTPGIYLEAFQSLGLRMAMSHVCPFPERYDKYPVMFCFTDGVTGVFMYLAYDEALKIDSNAEV